MYIRLKCELAICISGCNLLWVLDMNIYPIVVTYYKRRVLCGVIGVGFGVQLKQATCIACNGHNYFENWGLTLLQIILVCKCVCSHVNRKKIVMIWILNMYKLCIVFAINLNLRIDKFISTKGTKLNLKYNHLNK